MTSPRIRVLGLLPLLVLYVPNVLPNASVPRVARTASSRGREAAERKMREAYARLPLSFEANRGRISPQVDFVARGPGYTLFVTPTETVVKLQPPGTRRPAIRKSSSQDSDLVR